MWDIQPQLGHACAMQQPFWCNYILWLGVLVCSSNKGAKYCCLFDYSIWRTTLLWRATRSLYVWVWGCGEQVWSPHSFSHNLDLDPTSVNSLGPRLCSLPIWITQSWGFFGVGSQCKPTHCLRNHFPSILLESGCHVIVTSFYIHGLKPYFKLLGSLNFRLTTRITQCWTLFVLGPSINPPEGHTTPPPPKLPPISIPQQWWRSLWSIMRRSLHTIRCVDLMWSFCQPDTYLYLSSERLALQLRMDTNKIVVNNML